MARPRNTPNDDGRKERIMAAAVDVLESDGIERCTARRIAERAGVPVGSVSYHFKSKRDILLGALREIERSRQRDIEEWAATATAETIERDLARLILMHSTGDGRGLTMVSYELCIMGLRDEEFRRIALGMLYTMQRCLAVICGPERAACLASQVEGVQLDVLLASEPPTLESIEARL
ncbi:MAG: TetR family transcriptional regulator [Bifidobacterium sp.]|nr:TetR family transcriptional regulator [Bifidobacterium sp.]